MAYYPFLPYDKSEYLDMMQSIPETRGYLTSPMFQEGFEEWNPSSPINTLVEGSRKLADVVGKEPRGINVLGGIGTKESPPSGYPYPDYDPTKWGMEFGHEITHSSIPFQWSDIYKKLSQIGDVEAGDEEALNRMHDYMYGDYRNSDISGPGGYLRRKEYLSGDYLHNVGQYSHQMDFTPKAYDLIRNSNLKDWQNGVMSLGPTTSRGQIELGQRPDQVKAQGQAYMDPNRGNVQAPTMSQQQMVQEAALTGGTVNPHEVTKAAYRPNPHLSRGGIASLWHR